MVDLCPIYMALYGGIRIRRFLEVGIIFKIAADGYRIDDPFRKLAELLVGTFRLVDEKRTLTHLFYGIGVC